MAMLKTCSKCKKTKMGPEFNKRKRNGKTCLVSRCKECQAEDRKPKAAASRAYAKKYYQANKAVYCERSAIRGKAKLDRIEKIKIETPCMDCAEFFPPECMDFDHRDPSTKEFGLARARWKRWEEIEREMAKCDIVCANCHRVRTKARGIVNQYS